MNFASSDHMYFTYINATMHHFSYVWNCKTSLLAEQKKKKKVGKFENRWRLPLSTSSFPNHILLYLWYDRMTMRQTQRVAQSPVAQLRNVINSAFFWSIKHSAVFFTKWSKAPDSIQHQNRERSRVKNR